uniref:GRIP1 associated protein 1 n=1 Tax=Homo sapiens TaxID=9606 RepID=A0A994J417_HUMAN
MAQALSEEEFQRMQVPLAVGKTTRLGDRGRGSERSCYQL